MTDLDKLIKAIEDGTAAGRFHDLCGAAGLAAHMVDIAGANIRSLNAAENVFHALLPGWMWSIEAYDRAEVWPSLQPENVTFAQDEGGNHARMWLLATLKAYRSTQEAGQ